MLLSRDAVEDVEGVLDARDFYRPAHGDVFALIVELHRRGDPTDAIVVGHELGARGQLARIGGLVYLHTLIAAVATPANAAYHAEIVRDRARRRRVVEIGQRLQQLAHLETDDVDELLERARATLDVAQASGPGRSGLADAVIASRYEPLDWDEVFASDDVEPDWLIPEVIERGRSHVVFSPSKAGKSLLTLDMVAAIAAGRARLGRPPGEPETVLYVDIENSQADLHRRLLAMGYDAAALKRHLLYLSFPDLPPLDTAQGGAHLVALARHHGAVLVVLDTVSRVVAGPEDESDTFRDFYRHTGRHLKAEGVTVVRLDHAGKDPTRGQRGSSGKGDDVDTVWFLQPRGDGRRFTLRLDRQRSDSHPAEIQIERETDPLRHLVVATTRTGEDPAIAALADKLDDLGVPADAGRDTARRALTEAAISTSTTDLADAVRLRKARAAALPETVPDEPFEPLWRTE